MRCTHPPCARMLITHSFKHACALKQAAQQHLHPLLCLGQTALSSSQHASMSAPRRRRGRAAGEDELSQSLLEQDEPRSAAAASQQQQLIVHQPFHLDSFIAAVLAAWAAFLRSLRASLQALMSLAGAGGVRLSLVQAERLEELQGRLHVPYDARNPAHQEQLRELWAAAFPGVTCPASLKSSQWKDMGWQGDDPATDFRAAGLFGLDNLLYLATHQQLLWGRLRHKADGVRSQWEYPFAAGGINLTHELTELLGLARGSPGSLPCTREGVAFCELLRESDAAFEELYCTAFALLDRLWLARKASYMEFGLVMKDVKAALKDALGRRPKSVAQLQQHLDAIGR